MTCLEFRFLLDRKIDDELSAEELAQANEHLHRCTNCRDVLASLQRLKASLAISRPSHEPSVRYWEDSKQRILAKTTLSASPAPILSDTLPTEGSYTPLMRSVLSVAASIALLTGVLILGSHHERPAVVIHGPSGQMIVTAESADALHIEIGSPLTLGDQRRLGSACVLAGAPGMLSRFNCLPGLLRVY